MNEDMQRVVYFMNAILWIFQFLLEAISNSYMSLYSCNHIVKQPRMWIPSPNQVLELSRNFIGWTAMLHICNFMVRALHHGPQKTFSNWSKWVNCDINHLIVFHYTQCKPISIFCIECNVLCVQRRQTLWEYFSFNGRHLIVIPHMENVVHETYSNSSTSRGCVTIYCISFDVWP